MLNLYFFAAICIMLSGINEATYPRRSFHDIYYPLRKDAARIQPFIQEVIVMEHQKPEHQSQELFSPMANEDSNIARLLPNSNKISKRSNDEANMGKRVFLARIGKRQYYMARIGK